MEDWQVNADITESLPKMSGKWTPWSHTTHGEVDLFQNGLRSNLRTPKFKKFLRGACPQTPPSFPCLWSYARILACTHPCNCNPLLKSWLYMGLHGIYFLPNDSSFIFHSLSQVVEKSRAGFMRTEAFLEAYVDSFVEQTDNVHQALLLVLTQVEYEEFCVSCRNTKLSSD